MVIAMQGEVLGENKISSETRLEKASVEASEALDMVPSYLPPVAREILILFVNEVSSISSLHVQRVIQTAYLFHAAEVDIDLNGSPYLMSFINAFKQYKAPQNGREFVEAIKKTERYLSPEGKVNAEIKRLKLTTEINKLVPKIYSIPSYKTINTVLHLFEKRGYIHKSQTDRKTLWSINPDFYAKWLARRHQLFDERAQKIKEFQGTNTPPEQAEINANEFMLDKYGVIVLDFYNVNYVPYRIDTKAPDVKVVFKQSLYLRYREDIGLLLSY